mmetsp:Transcript_31206/g.104248  ORF Transcript_31206/g.104248 Transcript_31206/m.104248 type:complete len:359 (+) Transcript_31206:509-1585(+)
MIFATCVRVCLPAPAAVPPLAGAFQVLCSSSDQRCIAVDVRVPWYSRLPSPSSLQEMQSAFAAVARRAYAGGGRDNALPPEYEAQQAELQGLMALMNADFGKLLRFYALKYATDALAPTEQVEQATMTQLNFEGLSLEVTTIDASGYSLDLGEAPAQQQTWSASILFPRRCFAAAEVEDMLFYMFDNTAAAVEEGRINVEAVAPEPAAEALANQQREQQQQVEGAHEGACGAHAQPGSSRAGAGRSGRRRARSEEFAMQQADEAAGGEAVPGEAVLAEAAPPRRGRRGVHVNAAICNAKYQPVQLPVVIDLLPRRKGGVDPREGIRRLRKGASKGGARGGGGGSSRTAWGRAAAAGGG